MLKVHCIPQKILYENTSDDYKVLSCKYIDSSEEMELSKYNSFTLSGENHCISSNRNASFEVFAHFNR